MATKIRGITIELSADTAGVSKGLQKANKEIKSTQSQLKDVDRLLKLDPKNTELLAQKHKLLKKGIGETKDKLKELHNAEKELKSSGVDKNSEQFMALRREIIATEGSLKDYNKQQKEMSHAGETMGKIAKGIGVASAAVVTGAVAAGKTVVDLATKTAEYSDTVDKASIRMGTSAEYYQKLAYAANRSGVEMSTMEKAAKKLEGTGTNIEDAMADIMSYATAEERAAKASEYFGDSIAYTLSPLIEQSGEDFDGLMQRAEDLGLVLGGDDVKAGAKLGDTMADVKDAFDAIFIRIGARLLPLVQSLSEKIIKFLPKFFSLFDKLSPIIEDIGDVVLGIVSDLMDSGVLDEIIGIIEMIAPALAEILTTLAPIVSEIIQAILPALGTLVEKLLPVIMRVFEAIAPILAKIAPLLEPILTIILALLEPLFILLDKCILPLIELLANGLSKALEAIGPILQDVADWFDDVFHRIPEIAKKALNALIGFINKCIRGINKLIGPMMSVVESVGSLFGADWDLSNVRIPEIPMLAKGGILSSGSAIVGEAGPELLTLASGRAVVQPLTNNTTNNNSTSLGGVTINVTQAAGESSYELADRISEILAEQYGRERAVYA